MGGPSQTAKDPITTKTTTKTKTKTTGEEEHSNENGETRDNNEDEESDNQNENKNKTRGTLNANDNESDKADNNNNSNNNNNTNNNDNNDNNDNKENGNNTDDGDHPRRNAKPTTTPAGSCLLVTKALLRRDPGKYLPAITASLSAWASSVVAGNSNSSADPISLAVVKFWVSLLVDPSAPLELHDRLLNALLDVITVTTLVVVVVVVPDSRSPSRSLAALPSTREFLEAVILEPVFSLSGPTLLPSLSSSSSSSFVIRRASFAIRFLSWSCCLALPRLDRNALVRALETSGALKWLTGVLTTGTGDDNNSNSNSDSDNDNDYHGRLRLLDVLLEECECGCECRPVSSASNNAGFVPWVTLLASLLGLLPVLSDFVRDTCRRLVEEWGHQWSNPEGGVQSAHGCVSGYVSASRAWIALVDSRWLCRRSYSNNI